MENFININDTQIYYQENGEGQAVLFIPGWLYTTRLFERNLPVIGKAYRAIAYDPRSHGRSRITDLGNNYGQHGRDLNGLINELSLKDVILVGWSLGVTTVYSYIQQFGTANIAAFVSVDEAPGIIKQHQQDWGEGTLAEISSLVEMLSNNKYVEFFDDVLRHGFISEPDEDFAKSCISDADKTPVNIAALLIADAALRDYRELAKQIDNQIPILHILREDWSHAALAWINSNQPNAKTEVLGGHLQVYEYAESFNKLLLSFLDGVNIEITRDVV